MKKEWKDWIVNYAKNQEWELIDSKDNKILSRHYTWCRLPRNKVPFDSELNKYIESFIGHDDYLNTGYTLIKYEVGDYIGEHTDEYGGCAVTYVCEVQSSDCDSSLILNDVPVTECYYLNDVKHRVDPIKAGTRISLTMFGKKNTSII